MEQYTYSKDTRTDQQYRQNFEAGKRNQLIAITHFAQILQNEYPDPLQLLEIEDKEFQTVGSWNYHPDFEIKFKTISSYFEVKVSQRNSIEIDLKKSQIDSLAEYDNPRVLYATPTRYVVLKLEKILSAPLVLSDRFGNKNMYRLKSSDLSWRHWPVRPLFVKYL